jgi:hypothetical protein
MVYSSNLVARLSVYRCSIDSNKKSNLLQIRSRDVRHGSNSVCPLKGTFSDLPELRQVDPSWYPATALTCLKLGHFGPTQLANLRLIRRMNSFSDNVNLESLTIFVVKNFRVDSCCYCEWVVEWWAVRDGEDFGIGARKEGHDLCKKCTESRWSLLEILRFIRSVEQHASDRLGSQHLVGEIERDQRSLRFEDWIRKYEMRGLWVALKLSV